MEIREPDKRFIDIKCFEDLESFALQGGFRRDKFRLRLNSFWRLESNYDILDMSIDFYNAVAPLCTFNPVTEKYEGKFTLLQIWEHLL